VNRQVSINLDGEDGSTRMQAKLQGLRDAPPTELAGLPVTRFHDYAVAQRFAPDGSHAEPIGLPTTNLIQLELAAASGAGTLTVSIRPSGTEPKLKIYLEYLGEPGQSNLVAHQSSIEAQITALSQTLSKRF
jgi:phosphomannomutase